MDITILGMPSVPVAILPWGGCTGVPDLAGQCGGYNASPTSNFECPA